MTRRALPWLLPFTLAVIWVTLGVGYLASREVPTAIIKGKVIAEETGQPLPDVTIQLHGESLEPEQPTVEITLYSRPDGTLRARRIPAGRYVIEASSEAHELKRATLTLLEGEVREVSLELPPVPPFLDLRIPQHVFLPEEQPQVSAHGFVPEEALSFAFYRVDSTKLFQEQGGNLGYILYRGQEPSQVALQNVAGLTPAGTSSAPITKRDREGVFHQRFDLPRLQPGLYVVETTAGTVRQLTWVMITRLGLIVKYVQGDALAYVAELKTGAPVSGARVQFVPEKLTPVSGVTDTNGLFRTRVYTPSTTGGGESPRVTAWAEKDGSQAFVSYYAWERGAERHRVYTYTDRPVYRPGHQGFFNGIARTVQKVGYGVPAHQPVEVEIRDSRDSLVYKQTLTTDTYGTFHGNFSLSEEAATGYYSVRTKLAGDESESGFKVAEYRKPEFQIEVKTGKKRYTRGDTIEATVSAQYYYGAPVTGATVTYQVTREAYYYYYPEDYGGDEGEYEGEYEGDYYYAGELVLEGTAQTDDEGMAHLSIPSREQFILGKPERQFTNEEEPEEDERFTISATVTDIGGREVTEEGATIVTQGEFALNVDTESYVGQSRQAMGVMLTAQDYDGRPVSGVSVSVLAQPEIFTREEVRYGAGIELTAVTGKDGKATVTFTPSRTGYYRLRGTAYDQRGNRIRAYTYLWVTSEDYSDLGVQYPELEIIPDKRTYTKGDTATLLVNTQHAGATALFTIEGPKLFEYRLIQLKGKSTRVTLPITSEYAPNIYIAVALVRDKQFATQEERIKVSVKDRELQIAVTPNKTRYTPGERATYSILTRDASGKPVPAQASIGIVDESIYAIQGEMVPPILDYFYQPRGNSVGTSYSFPYFYLDANKEPAQIKVRKRFPDTAYWNPTVVTGADGRATISFSMPDTLTTWRATTRAATLDTAVGQTITKVQTAKDLIVRLEVPRFFTQKDTVTISAVVHNYSKIPQEISLWIRAPGITFNGKTQPPRIDTFTLDPEKAYRREWEIGIPSPGNKEITIYAKAKSGLNDAMALILPALPHGREVVEWRSGSVTATTTERFLLRKDALPGAGEVRLRFTPSLAGAIFGALDYLTSYPYGCTEQTMSSFLPDVVVARTLRELKLSNSKLQQKLSDMVRVGLDRLYSYQHEDGGWGWWRYDESDPWMTSYVIYGLLLAQRNGFAVNESALSRGVDRLTQFLQPTVQLNPQNQTFLAQVLVLAGRKDTVSSLINSLLTRYHELDTASLARLTSTLITLDRLAEARTLSQQLWGQATESGALLWWPGTGPDYGHAGTSEVERTALAFQALDEFSPTDPRLAKIIRWLVLHRRGGAWISTRDTAFVVFAITDYIKRMQELKPDYQVTVTFGNRVLLNRRFTSADVFAPEVEVRVPRATLQVGSNVVQITKTGAGNLYYTAAFTQFVYQEDMAALVNSAGISVTREYFALHTGRYPQTGQRTTLPAATPTTDLRLGESYLVRLTVRSPRDYEYMVVEDYLPSGAEAQDRGVFEFWEWDQWYADMEVRDEKVAFFARNLPEGKSVFEYYLRPQFPGDYHALPTVAYNMYAPDVRGSGAETRVRIR